MRKIRNILLIISLLFISYVFNSELIMIDSTKYIDCNTISTPFRNNGSFNRNPATGNSGFEWPIGENKYARYASGIWIGAKVEDDTLVAVCEYDYEFFPGYTDNSGNPQGKLDTLNRVYKILADVNDHDRTYWPNALLGNSDQGAPVFFDNTSNTWKPLDFGWQTMYTRFTDSYPESHGNNAGNTAPLKADVKLITYAFHNNLVLSNVIFQHYRIINRSNKPWMHTFFTFWTDDDLGEIMDDKMGCDTNLNMGYTYNGDNYDDMYGSAPPSVSFLLLKGPSFYTGNQSDTSYFCWGKELKIRTGYKDKNMNSLNRFRNDGPSNYRETYNMMLGLDAYLSYQNQVPWINPITGLPTTYVYSGDPVSNSGWIDPNSDDKSFYLNTGPVDIPAGDTVDIVLAQVIARGTSNLNSITVLRQYAQDVRNFYKNCFSGVPIGIEPVTQNVPDRFKLFQNYPNPFNPSTKLRFAVKSETSNVKSKIQLVIYNALGQVVATLIDAEMNAGIHEVEFDARNGQGSNFASGVYFYSLIVGDNIIDTRKMVLMK